MRKQKKALAAELLETYVNLDLLEKMSEDKDIPKNISVKCYGLRYENSIELKDEEDIVAVLELITSKMLEKEKKLRKELASLDVRFPHR